MSADFDFGGGDGDFDFGGGGAEVSTASAADSGAGFQSGEAAGSVPVGANMDTTTGSNGEPARDAAAAGNNGDDETGVRIFVDDDVGDIVAPQGALSGESCSCTHTSA